MNKVKIWIEAVRLDNEGEFYIAIDDIVCLKDNDKVQLCTGEWFRVYDEDVQKIRKGHHVCV